MWSGHTNSTWNDQHSSQGLSESKVLSPWKNSYDQPRQYIQNQRHYFADKGPFSPNMVFPVVMYGCQSWTINKAES